MGDAEAVRNALKALRELAAVEIRRLENLMVEVRDDDTAMDMRISFFQVMDNACTKAVKAACTARKECGDAVVYQLYQFRTQMVSVNV